MFSFSVSHSDKAKTELAQFALGYIYIGDGRFTTKEVLGGTLACAKVVTTILNDYGLIDWISINVDETVKKLKEEGWVSSQERQQGSVVVWDKTKRFKHKHIGIVVDDKYAVNNSSFSKFPILSEISGRKVIEYLIPPIKEKGAEIKDSEVAKQDLGVWRLSRYYTPVKNQKKYPYNKTYEKAFAMNCHGDCLSTASGYKLSEKDAFKVVACPKSIKLGSKLYVEGLGEVRCEDRGGAIKGKRLDLWAGIGDKGVSNIINNPQTAGKHKVYLLTE